MRRLLIDSLERTHHQLKSAISNQKCQNYHLQLQIITVDRERNNGWSLLEKFSATNCTN